VPRGGGPCAEPARAEIRFGHPHRDGRAIADLHATILHLLGIDDEKLTYRYSGRDFPLTDVHGTVVREILA
jgi:hypothetical protein